MKSYFSVIVLSLVFILFTSCNNTDEVSKNQHSGETSLIDTISETDNADCVYEEESTNLVLDENGGFLKAQNSLPQEVVDNVYKYLLDNGYCVKGLNFIFLNSPKTSSPKEVREQQLDFFYPQPIKKEDKYSDNAPYYIEEEYVECGTVGYFAVDEKGKIIEKYGLKTADELRSMEFKRELKNKKIEDIAVKAMYGEDHHYGDGHFVYSNDAYLSIVDSEAVICYKITFDFGNEKVYINSVNGDVLDVRHTE